ncbi:MAG TPA: metallophosphoesterase [Planctomycetota bacterium]|nr:metallophosphoesterase [Planctomycetota bacterium]
MPRIAILSDIHANINAFQAVLEDLEKKGGCDRMYCLGDVIGYGPRPTECLALARQHFQLTLKGNHEQAVVEGAKDFNDMARRAIDWTRTTILPDAANATEEQQTNWAYVSQLPEVMNDGILQFVHGAPQDPVNEYIMPMDIDPQTKTYGDKLYTAFTMTQWITFCGHSHMPALYCQDGFFLSPTFQKEVSYQCATNMRYIINVGSVGQPRDGDNRACYCIWDEGKITWRRVPYDIQDTYNSVVGISQLDITLGERLFRGE